ncbi:MAG: N-methyl-L-tryptophan oxidase [Actinomycetota bacterium]
MTARSSDDATFDLIVVGLGAMGSATVYQAARRGLRVLGLDRHDPPHDLGSTHAETRITRLAVGEGEQYLPFVARSHEIWRELEAESGEPLLYQCGGLIVTEQQPVAGQRWHDFVIETDRVARSAGIDFAVLDDPLDHRVPTALLGLEGKRIGHEPSAGLVLAERAVAVQLALAADRGADVRTRERVTAVRAGAGGVEVVAGPRHYRADRVVLSAGPWLPGLIGGGDAGRLRVTRQTVFWFEVDDADRYRADGFPFVMWIGDEDADYLGVFPLLPGTTPALKVLGEQFVTDTTPDTVDRTVTAAEIDDIHRRLVGPRLAGVRPTCVRAEVCLYTNTPDDHFLIDWADESDRIMVVSPCSGHGFKHSAAIGEAVVEQMTTGRSTLDLRPFGRDRLVRPAASSWPANQQIRPPSG